jgi:tRNA threonylcarbamoyladenosine biosynthesis protein TsaE
MEDPYAPVWWLANSTDDLPAIARHLLTAAGDCRVLTFEGDLGAGKTTLVKAICAELGVEEAVTSPTYALANEYGYLDEGGHHHLVYHLDLYRLTHLEEALAIGIEEYLSSGEYCLIEWPDLIETLLPNGYGRVSMEIGDEGQRKIVFLRGLIHSANS